MALGILNAVVQYLWQYVRYWVNEVSFSSTRITFDRLYARTKNTRHVPGFDLLSPWRMLGSALWYQLKINPLVLLQTLPAALIIAHCPGARFRTASCYWLVPDSRSVCWFKAAIATEMWAATTQPSAKLAFFPWQLWHASDNSSVAPNYFWWWRVGEARELGFFRVISAFCHTPVAQNAEITWKNPSSVYRLGLGSGDVRPGIEIFIVIPRFDPMSVE